MIIVSQEKTWLVNFNNVCQITLAIDEEETEYAIMVETVDKEEIIMGVYQTEERAIEVLQEIIIAIRGTNMAQFSNGEVKEVYQIKNDVYEMPKE